jgi:hypothetical protein
VIFALQGAYLSKKHEGSRKEKAKIVQKKQMSAGRNIKNGDVRTAAHIPVFLF